MTNGLRVASDVTRFKPDVPLMVHAGVDSASLIRGFDDVVQRGSAANAHPEDPE